MAGIYVHIPYCKKACHYCNFHFSVSLKNKNDFIQALLKETLLQSNYMQRDQITSIYFGGGTPSLLEKEDLLQIFHQLYNCFNIAPKAEITLEANPDDITAERLADWKEAGINRLSIGIQSFFEEDLLWMNRAHNAEQAKACIVLARQAGFYNLSIDLIYGTPGLTDEKWNENVAAALAFDVPHLSCYALTVEPGTALQKMIAQHKKEDVDTEKQARHFLLLMDWLQQAGYEHYEISNFAKPGYKSRHNSSYWAGKKYLGLGPSAHSFDGSRRQWNIASNALYIQSLTLDKIPFEEEKLTITQHLNEYIMTSLRTQEGLNLIQVEKKFGKTASQQLQKNSQKYIARQKMLLNGSLLQLTGEGKLFADGIAADLFFLEDTVLTAAPGISGSYDDVNNLQPEPPSGEAPLL
ncbi:MAG TPA: radical SAM family heme chaperone HemW [Chitinophagaceae bacterium]|nr:radical SAM family heme chaperone HemW [Chitinophagaceae bacterium]